MCKLGLKIKLPKDAAARIKDAAVQGVHSSAKKVVDTSNLPKQKVAVGKKRRRSY